MVTPHIHLGNSDKAVNTIEVIAQLLDGDRVVIAGGLAVMARLGVVHRSTIDIDSVVTDLAASTQVIMASGGTEHDRHFWIGDTPIDLIEIDPDTTWAAIGDVGADNGVGMLFVAAHKLIWEQASPVRFSAGDTSVVAPCGSTLAVMFAKVGAYLSPRRDVAKHGSDATDLWRLLTAIDAITDMPPLHAVAAATLDYGLSEVIRTVPTLRMRIEHDEALPEAGHIVRTINRIRSTLQDHTAGPLA